MYFISIIFITAFLMEAIGTYISVYGLDALFAGDVVILTMAVILDVAKIVTVSFLYRHWRDIKPIMKYYLLVAVIILMTITSVGAFGYLSGAFQKAISPNVTSNLHIDSLKHERDSLVAEKDQLNLQREDINKQIAQLPTNSVKGRRILIASFKPETNRISDRLILITHKVDDLNIEVLKVESENVDKNVHVGPILYVAKAFNISVEDASKWIILTIISVFDPLSIMLILAGNFLVKRKESEPVIHETPVVLKYESPGVPIHEETQATILVADLEEEIKMFADLEQSHPDAKAAMEAGKQWVKDTFHPDGIALPVEPIKHSELDTFKLAATYVQPVEEVDLRTIDDLGQLLTDGIVTYIPEPEPLVEEELELLSLVYDDIDTGEAPSEEIDTEALALAFKDYVPVIPAIDVTGDSTYSGSPQADLIVEEPVKKNNSTIDLDSQIELIRQKALETCSLDSLIINMPEALIRVGVVTPSIKKMLYDY